MHTGAAERDWGWAERREDGWHLVIRVQPGAGRSQAAGMHDGTPKVRVAAPANEGKANDELIRFLAKSFDVSKGRVQIIGGHRARMKHIVIDADIDPGVLDPGSAGSG